MIKQIKEKEQNIPDFKQHEHDSGSTAVQVAALTVRIKELTGHCQIHKKDMSSRHGLIVLVSKRRKLLKYLHRHDTAQYANVIQTLGLKK